MVSTEADIYVLLYKMVKGHTPATNKSLFQQKVIISIFCENSHRWNRLSDSAMNADPSHHPDRFLKVTHYRAVKGLGMKAMAVL